MREAWESLIRDFVRHLKGTNRALSTQTIYRRAALGLGLVDHLEQDGLLPAPRQLTRRHVEGYIGDLVETRSASTANVTYRALQQFMKWLLDEEEMDRSPMERMKPPIVSGSVWIVSPWMTTSRRAFCTSTTGVAPLTVIVSATPPTRISAEIVSVDEPVSCRPSRFTVVKPGSVKVTT